MLLLEQDLFTVYAGFFDKGDAGQRKPPGLGAPAEEPAAAPSPSPEAVAPSPDASVQQGAVVVAAGAPSPQPPASAPRRRRSSVRLQQDGSVVIQLTVLDFGVVCFVLGMVAILMARRGSRG